MDILKKLRNCKPCQKRKAYLKKMANKVLSGFSTDKKKK